MLKQSNTLNFIGENIYVGIDVHLKSWSVCIMTTHLTHKAFRQDPDPLVLVSYLTRHFPGGTYYSVYEAGFCGLWIHNKLRELGVHSLVVNPADVPTSDKEHKHKSDPVDAGKLARSLRSGELKGIYTHGQESLYARSLLRVRNSIVIDMTRTKNRIKGMLYYYGIHYPASFSMGKGHWSRLFIRWLKEDVLLHESIARTAFLLLLEEYEYSRFQLLKANREIRELACFRYKEDLRLITSIPGVGFLTGIHILVQVEQIDRFGSRDKFAGFLGMVPTTRNSGDKNSTGRISPRQQKELRSLLIESAWIAARYDPALSANFHKLCHRMDKNKAIIRIAKQLANRIYYVLKNKVEYVNGLV